MDKHSRWLSKELDRWSANGLVTPDQAARIRALYPPPEAGAPWGMIAFSGIGAVVLGLGVILLLAYNWDAIPSLLRLVLVLLATGAAHTAGLVLRERNDWRATLGEVMSLLGTMFFGAGIWLVAQIYHIEEHYPNGYLYWGIGALLMAWALRSTPQGLLAVVTLCFWGGSEVIDFGFNADVASLLIAFGVGSLAWRNRSALLTSFVVLGLYLMITIHAGHWGGASTGYLAAFALSALLLGLGRLWQERDDFENVARVMAFLGTVGFVVCAYIFTFEDAADDLLRHPREMEEGAALAFCYRWVLFVFGAMVWAWLLRLRLAGDRARVALEDWLCPATLLLVQVLSVIGGREYSFLAAVVFNLAVFALASMWMVRGCRDGGVGRTVTGSLVLAALVFARFFDLFDSLALRGLVFVVLGGVLFAEGFYYRKLRREAREPGVVR